MSASLVKGKKYTFTTKYPAVLGGKYKNMVLEGLDLSSSLASNYSDIRIIHANVKGVAEENDYIKQTTVEQLNWLIFKNQDNGEYIVLAKDYIDLSTLSESGNDYPFIVRNISNVDIPVIKKVLAEVGYTLEELDIVV